MAKKGKSFHDTVIRRLKKQEPKLWTNSFHEMKKEHSFLEVIAEEHPLVTSSPYLNGCCIDLFREAQLGRHFLSLTANPNVSRPVYLGLVASWFNQPKAISLEGDSRNIWLSGDFLTKTTFADFGRYFPGCLLIDTRRCDLAYNSVKGTKTAVEAVFAYPTYDRDLKKEAVAFVGIGPAGFNESVEAVLFAEGNTVADMLDFSLAEYKRAKAQSIINRSVFKAVNKENLADDVTKNQPFYVLNLSEEFLLDMSNLMAYISTDAVHITVTEYSDKTYIEVSPPEAENKGEAHANNNTDSKASDKEINTEPSVLELIQEPEPEPKSEIELLREAIHEADLLHNEMQRDLDLAKNHAKTLQDRVTSLEKELSTANYTLKKTQDEADSIKKLNTALAQRASVIDTLDLPTTPLEALLLAERLYSDKIVVLDKAKTSAEEFVKGNTVEVWNVLRSIAVTLHPMFMSKDGGNIPEKFTNITGFEISLRDTKEMRRNSKLNKLRRVKYKNEYRDTYPHVKGKNVKKGESLRVHFFVDHAENKIVIAHCGEHLKTILTSTF